MFKIVCIIAVLSVLAAQQNVSAFKIVNVSVNRANVPASTSSTTSTVAAASSSPSTSSSSSASPFNKSALIQSYNTAVNSKLRALGTFVSQFLQAKNNFKSSILRSLPSAGSASTTVNANAIPLFTKSVSFNVNGATTTSG